MASIVASMDVTGDKRPTVEVKVCEELQTRALYDTGAAISGVSARLMAHLSPHKRPWIDSRNVPSVQTVDGKQLTVLGSCQLNLLVLGKQLKGTFLVIEELSSDVLLGADFIRQQGLNYDAQHNKLFLASDKSWHSAAMVCSAVTAIPAGSAKMIQARAFYKPGVAVKGPDTIVATVRSESLPIAGAETILNVNSHGYVNMMVSNLMDTAIEIPRGAFLGAIQKVDLEKCEKLDLDLKEDPKSRKPDGSKCQPEKAEMLKNTILQQVKKLPPHLQKAYVDLIMFNHDVFSKDKFDLGRTSTMEHEIRLKDKEPAYRRQYRIPEEHRRILLEHLEVWVKLGVVHPSKSDYNAPIFLVPKKTGDLRPVLDFRELNAKSYVDKYSSREVGDCIDEVGRAGSRVFTSLDLTAGFWQLPLAKGSRKFTAFTIPGQGSYEWAMTPMGLLGSPASFGRLMDYVMRGLQIIAYQDDLLCHS